MLNTCYWDSINFYTNSNYLVIYSNALPDRKLVKSLPKAWETKAFILEEGDLQKMRYDELWGNWISYKHNHINRYSKNEKIKTVAFTAETTYIGKEVDENQSEGITFINKGVKQMVRQRRRRPQQEFNNNEFKINDDRYYYCRKSGHI